MATGRQRISRVILVCAMAVLALELGTWWLRRSSQSDWDRHRAEVAARGESLDWKDYIPRSRPPDAENYAATPLIRAIGYRAKVDSKIWEPIAALSREKELGRTGDWTMGQRAELESIQAAIGRSEPRGPASKRTPALDVLGALEPLREDFDKLRAASRLPQAQLNLEHTDPFGPDMPNYVAFRTLAQMLSLRACAELALGQQDDAFADLEVIYRLAELTRAEPTLV